MRSNTFHEELPVKLNEDERNLRGRQAARLSVALRAHQDRAKEAKKKLADEEKRLTEALHKASDAAENGEEKRQVECTEVLRGVMVEVIRLDTHETVSSRPAEKAELAGAPVLVPGGGSKKRQPAEDDDAPASSDFSRH